MSAATFVPGTPSTNLARRVMLAVRHAMTALPTTNAHAYRVPSLTEEADNRYVARAVAPDPLDDLSNATWEDAEWQ